MTGAASPRAEVEHLMEVALARRARRLPRRELLVELGLTLAFAVSVAALLLLPGAPLHAETMIPLVVVAYAFASRVDYPIATGFAVPTQLFLVGLFAHADASLVPLLVLAGLALGTAGSCLAGHSRWDRLALCPADAIYALGPAIVFTATGHADASTAPWPIIVSALVSQFAVEFVSSAVRDRLVRGIRPQMQAFVLVSVWAADVALTPIGIMAVAASSTIEWAPLALLPLVALAAHTARDRLDRTERLRTRLDALDRERRRLKIAVQRIGDAFASNLDLDALTTIVTRAAIEALDADTGRASVVRSTGLLPRFASAASPTLTALLDAAEGAALASGRPADASAASAWARALPISPLGAPVAVVSVAREGPPLGDQELELFAYLCEQAGVAAGNIVTHERLHHQALTDELTGLANHRRLQDLLAAAIGARTPGGSGVALLLMDLDDFKLVNDAHGHQVGDLVLRAVGACLRKHCRTGEEPARYGGEELAVVVLDGDLGRARGLAERLRQEIEALEIEGPGGVPIRVTVSVGVATLGVGVTTTSELITAADAALYDAKAAGKNRSSVAAPGSPVARRASRPSGELLGKVRQGLDRDEFVLFYQPKVSLPGRAPVGVEALLRWRHPEHGLLGPQRFLAGVEGSELMPELTRWVMRRAAHQAVAWRAMGLDLPVAVNISAQDLADPRLPRTVVDVLQEAGAVAGDLRLEITEHMAMTDADRAQATLLELRALGVGLSLDDFGRGHSSLTRLRDLPVDELKLDRGFLRSPEATADVAVARAAITLGRDLGLTVIAEGVEDLTVLTILQAMGCQLVQGFCIAPPLLPEELLRWLGQQPAHR